MPCSRNTRPPPTAITPGALLNWDSEAILLAAPDRAGLIERARELVDWLSQPRREALKDVAYTLNCAEAHQSGGARLGIVAATFAELSDRLSAAIAETARPRLPLDPRRPRRLLLGRAALSTPAARAWPSSSPARDRNTRA